MQSSKSQSMWWEWCQYVSAWSAAAVMSQSCAWWNSGVRHGCYQSNIVFCDELLICFMKLTFLQPALSACSYISQNTFGQAWQNVLYDLRHILTNSQTTVKREAWCSILPNETWTGGRGEERRSDKETNERVENKRTEQTTGSMLTPG